MITSITFQFAYNKNYLNKEIQKVFPLGDRYTTDLEKLLLEDINFLEKIHALVSELNSFLFTCEIEKKIIKHLGHAPRITNKTKHKRTYYIGGLTIHEQDQTGH